VIVQDCTKGVSPETTQQARKEFKDAGVEFIQSSELLNLFKTE
jgi:hypothetical protein